MLGPSSSAAPIPDSSPHSKRKAPLATQVGGRKSQWQLASHLSWRIADLRTLQASSQKVCSVNEAAGVRPTPPLWNRKQPFPCLKGDFPGFCHHSGGLVYMARLRSLFLLAAKA